jgi:hypothetical protein
MFNPFTAIIGYASFKKNPIKTGFKFIKTKVGTVTNVNHESIPDSAYRQLADRSYTIAELAQSRDGFIPEYVNSLEVTVLQIESVMNGLDGYADQSIREILVENGVAVPEKKEERGPLDPLSQLLIKN